MGRVIVIESLTSPTFHSRQTENVTLVRVAYCFTAITSNTLCSRGVLHDVIAIVVRVQYYLKRRDYEKSVYMLAVSYTCLGNRDIQCVAAIS